MSSEICPKCGDEFKSLGHHWRYNDDHRPPLSDKQVEILIGIVMGDATVHRPKGKNAHISCEMTNVEYLEYVSSKFPVMSQGVKLKHTPEECANRARNSGFRPNAKKENYSAMYRWSCKAHPDIEKFRGWYNSGTKVWPDTVSLTPTVLKHWYCCDGNLEVRGSNISLSIGLSNEADNKNKINTMFEISGLPKPSWNDYVDKEGYRNAQIYFNVDDGKRLLSYMGEPLPGFEYKWGVE
jgi:hypothetical protein